MAGDLLTNRLISTHTHTPSGFCRVEITLKIFKLYQLDSKQKCPKVLMINVNNKAKLCIHEREGKDIEDCLFNTDK